MALFCLSRLARSARRRSTSRKRVELVGVGHRDGPAEEAVKLLRVEIVLLALSVAAIFLERARLRRLERL
jgi:hypothetical protein